MRLLSLCVVLLCAATLGGAPRNVLFVVVDDLNTDLGCYGAKQVHTPHIDRLAAGGVRFDRAHSQYPLCNPSRVSFLTGRRPETTGVYVLNTPARKALPEAVTLPQFFRQNGYFTAGAGKIFHNRATNDAESWDFYEDLEGEDAQEKAAISARYGGGDGRPRGHVLDGDGSKTRDGINSATIKRLLAERATDQRPFFLALGFHKPHLPWTAPKRFFDLYSAPSLRPSPEPKMVDIPAIALQTELTGFAQPDSVPEALQAYYACVSFIDDLLGSVLSELDRLKLRENTVVVFFSDHGFHLGDHGGLWAKLSAFERSTRVPLIIAGAGVPAGKTVSAPVELCDVYPTLAQLSGLPAPADLEGLSLVPAINGQPLSRNYASSMVFHYDPSSQRDVLGRTIIGQEWRYTEWDQGSAGKELYLKHNDPGEYQNRASEASLSSTIATAKTELQRLPQPKPGPANRPRALLPKGNK